MHMNMTHQMNNNKMNLLEFVLAISLISFGSNQTFFLPHRITEAASLFWSLRELQKKQKPEI